MFNFDNTVTSLIDNIEVTASDIQHIEKEAVAPLIAGVGKALLPAAKTLARPFMNTLSRIPGARRAGQAVAGNTTGQLAKAKQWGGAIAADWKASGTAGKGLIASTSSALQTGMKVSPGITTAAIAAPAFALGRPGGNTAKNKEITQPGTIMLRADDEVGGVDKQALMENQDPLDLMVKGIISGVTLGAGLALNSKFKGIKLRNEGYSQATEGLRNMGNSVTPFYEKSVQNFEAMRKAPVAAINDIRLQNIFRGTLDDVRKYIEETKKNLSKVELDNFKLTMQKEFNKNKNTLPPGVRNELWEIIEKI